MAIDNYLASIRSASYGTDVRNAIANALSECYNLAVANANNSYVAGVKAELNTTVNNLRSQVTALQQAISGIRSFSPSDLNGVNGSISALTTRVGNLETQKTTQQTDINTLKTTTTGLRTSLTQLQTMVNGFHSFTSADLAGVNQQIAGIISNVSAIQTQYSAHQIDATGMRGELDQLQTDLAALRAVVEGLTALSGTAEDIEELQDQLQIILAGINDRITALSAKHDTELAALHQEIAGEMNQLICPALKK